MGEPLSGAIAPLRSMFAAWQTLLICAITAFGFGAAATADAASLQWDNNGALPVNGGSGSWNTTTALWFNGATFQTWNNATLDDAVLGATAGTVTLAVPITAHSLAFNTTGYTVTGNTLTLAGAAPGVSVVSGGTATIASVVAGADGLTKTGAGALILTNTNTYAGGTTISAGTLHVGNGATGSIVGNVVNNGALIFNRTGVIPTYSGDISGSGTVTKSGSSTLTLAGDNTYSGSTTISGTGSRLQGGAENAFSSASAHTVGTGAFLALGGFDQGIGSLAGAGTVTNGGAGAATLTAGSNDASTSFTGIIQNEVGATGLNKVGAGTLTLTNAGNTYSGATTVSGGTLQAGATNALAQNSAHTVAAGAALSLNNFSVAVGSLAGAGTVTNGGAAGRVITTGSDGTSTAFAGTIQNGGAGSTGLTKVGGGTFTLSGANTYTGATAINAGTMRGEASNAFSAASAHTVAAGAALDLGGFNQSIASLAGAGNVTNTGAAAATLTAAGATTFSGIIHDGVGTTGLTKTGTGTLTLTGENTFTGATTISGGTLQVGNAAGTAGSIASNVINNGALIFNRSVALTYGGDISGTGTVTKSGAGTLTLTGDNSYSGNTTLSTVGSRLQGGAENAFSAASAHTLATGTVLDLFGFDQAVGSIAGSGGVTNGSASAATLTSGGNGTSTTFSGAIQNGAAPAASTALTKVGAGTLTLSGATNTYTGATNVTGGSLLATTTGALGQNSAVTVASGATLGVNASQTIGSLAGAGTVTNGSTGARILTTGGDNTSTTFSGGIQNGVSAAATTALVKAGSGIFTLSGTNTYTGTTSVNAGTVHGGAANAFSAASAHTVAAGAVLDLGGFNQAITSLAGAGTVTNTGGAAAILTTGGATTFSGVIEDGTATTGMAKVGAGIFTLTGSNTYTGLTTISAGTLQVGNGATGSVAGDILNNGALIFNRTGVIPNYGGNISGSGTLAKSGASTLTLTGDNTYTGATTISGTGSRLQGGAENAFSAASAHTLGTGTFLDLGGFDQSIGSLAGTGRVTNAGVSAATLTTGGNNTSTSYSGIIQNEVGVTGLNKVGSGTLTLLGTNTYTGATTVNSGTLSAAATGALGQNSAVTVASSATLGINISQSIGSLIGAGTVTNGSAVARALTTGGDGTSTAFSGVIQNGAGAASMALTKVGGGTFTLSGANAYTGATAVNAGTLQGAAVNAFSAVSAHTVAAGAVLDLGGFNQTVAALAGAGTVTNAGGAAATLTAGGNGTSTTFSGIIEDGAGTTGLTKVGAGTLTLTGGSTFTGGTTISAGALQVGSGAIGSITGDILNNSALIFNRTGTLTYGGDISGSGTVTKSGTGALTLTGDSSFLGGTTISAGTLQLGNGGTAGSITGNIVDNGVLAINRSDALTLAGTISGTGTLSKAGAGTLTLTGNNSYAGTTTISAGTLQLGDGGTTGSIIGGIVDNATLAFNRSNALTYGGVISGTGALVQDGAGTLTLTANNTYAAGTTINAGTLQLGSGGNAGSVTGNIGNDGALIFNRGNAQTYAGDISGSGSVTKIGGNTLTLTGNNTFAGGTTISAGTLQIGSGTLGSITGDIVDNSALIFNRSDALTYGGAISGTGAVTKAGVGTLTLTGNSGYTGGTTISAGTLQIGNGGTTGSVAGNLVNNGIFIFDRSNALTYAGSISGTGSLIKNGAGTLMLTGINPYSGGTTVNEGKLLLNNAIVPASLVASPNGFVGGNGSVGSTTISGTLSPGNSIGVISVLGNLTFVPGSTFLVEVSPAAADRTAVTGTANLSGLVQVVGEPGTYVPDKLYTIVAAAGVNGEFDGLTSNFASSAFLTPLLSYDASNAYFSLAVTASFASVGQTPNQIATGAAVETLGFGNPIYDLVLMDTAEQAREAFESLSGEVHASVSNVLASDSRYVRDAILGRMRRASYASTTDKNVALAGPAETAVTAGVARGRMALGAGGADDIRLAAPNPLTFWTRGIGSWGEFNGNGNGNAATAQRTLAGFVSGMDAEVGGGWRAGLATGYLQSNINVGARSSSADVDGYILAAYGAGAVGPFALRSGAAWTWNSIDSTRSVMFPGFYERELANYDAGTGQLFAEVAYPMLTEYGPLEPFAGLAWVRVTRDDFTESGAAAALTSSSSTEGMGYSTLGIRAATLPQPAWGITITPRGSIAWQHAFGDLSPIQALAFASNDIAFGIAGVPVVQDSALVDAGFDLALGADAFVSISYIGQLATDLHDNGLQGRLDWRF